MNTKRGYLKTWSCKELEVSVDKPGYVRGKHYTAYITTVRKVKQRGDFVATESLLLELIAQQKLNRALSAGA